jgi:orotidine-5'-phosphate decarboxylase
MSSSTKSVVSKTYGERVGLHQNKAAQDLLRTMDRKKTNLCVSVDVTTKDELLRIVQAVGESCCCIKVSRFVTSGLERDTQRRTERTQRELNVPLDNFHMC